MVIQRAHLLLVLYNGSEVWPEAMGFSASDLRPSYVFISLSLWPSHSSKLLLDIALSRSAAPTLCFLAGDMLNS